MKKIIAILMAVLTLATVCLSVVSCDFLNNEEEKTTEDAAVVLNEMPELMSDEGREERRVRGVKLMAAAPVAETGATRTLTATVLPSTATNKAVDWSVAWANPNGSFEKGKTVTDYITVTPSSNGSTTATVTCKKAFADAPIIITVTTRAGGFTAQTAVTYVGIPTGMQIKDNGVKDSKGRYAAVAQTTTDFAINLSNSFGVVTDTYKTDYAQFELVSVQGYGSFSCSGKSFNSMMNQWMPTGDSKTINIADILDELVSVSIANGKVRVTAEEPIESYSVTETIDGSAVGLPNTTNVYSYASGVENCYFTVTIKDKYTGLTTSANFYISCDANGVNVSDETVIF